MNCLLARNVLLGIATAISTGFITSQTLAAQTNSWPNMPAPLVSVLTPQANNTYSNDTVQTQIQLDASADVTSFHASDARR
jgi:hypothetical protein